MKTYRVSKRYLGYRVALASSFYPLVVLITYLLLQEFKYMQYFPLVVGGCLFCLCCDLGQAFFYWRYATLTFSAEKVTVTRGKLFYSHAQIPLGKLFLLSESTNLYLALFALKKVNLQTVAQTLTFAGLDQEVKLDLRKLGE